MTHEPSPLDPDVRALLSLERAADGEVPSDSKDKLRRRLQASLGAAALGVGVGAVATGASAAKTGAVGGSILGGGWLLALGTFFLGAIAGAGIHALTRPAPAPPSPPSVTTVVVEKKVEVPVYVSASVLPANPPPPPVAPTSQIGQPTAHPSIATTSASGQKDTALAAERSLLEIARSALARGDSASALDALGTHQAQFPNGQLSEEREALYVQALAMAGRTAEAKQRADRFRKTWPGSMLLPVVQAAVE